MNAIGQFLKATLLGGIVFVAPLVVVYVLLRQALQFLGGVLAPIAERLPDGKFAGIVIPDLVALAALVAVCFLAGLVIATRPGRAMSDRLERLALRRVPGFTLLKTLSGGIAGLKTDSDMCTALIRFDDAWVLGFVVERHAGGLVTVFVPSARTPAAGSIYIMSAQRIQPLGVSMMGAANTVMHLGVGLRDLIEAAGAQFEPPGGAA